MSKISIYEFQSSRKRNVNKYRQYCKDLIANEAADELLKYAASIFRSDINDRFEEELQLLIKATKGLSFFQEMNSKIKNVEKRLHLQCCQRMTYKFFRKGEIIFKQGDKADKAYIILDGSVNVYCFLEHHILSDLCSKSKKKFHALPQHARKLHPISIVNQARREKVKNKMALPLHLLRKIGGRPSVHKTEEYVQQIQQTNQIIEDIREEEEKDKKMLESMAQIGLEMTNGIPPGCIRDLEFCFSDGVFKHKFITEMGVGQMFGEIALLLGQPRSASIIAKQNVECAVLNQDDYKQLLRDVELDKIEQRIRFFQSYFFRDQPRFVVLRYCYNFKKIKLNRGSSIFEEGDKPTHIYLIKRGDIELQYRQAVDKQISEQALQELARSQEQILMIPKRDKIIDDIKFQFDRICITIPETQIIGDIEILMKLPERQCSAVVRSDHARLYQISISHFYRILSDQQQLKKQFLQVAKQKYELNQQIRENIFNFYQQQNDKQKINQQIYLINLKRQIEQEELIVTSDRQLTDTDRMMLSADKCIANTERVNSKIKTEEDPLLQTNSLRTLVTKIKRYVRHPHSKQVLRQKERDEELFREEMRNMEHYSNKIKSRQSSNNAKELTQKNLDSIKKSSSPRFQFPRFDSENNSPSRRAYLNFNKKDTVNIYMRSTKSTNVSVKQGEQMGNNSQIENRLSPPPNNTHIIDRLNQQNKMISSKHNLFRSKPSTEYLLNRYGYKEKDKSII